MKNKAIYMALAVCFFSTSSSISFANSQAAVLPADPRSQITLQVATPKTVDQLIREKSYKYGLDQDLVKAVIHRESGGNIKARSPKDARGIMQVIPDTAARMGVNPRHLYIPERNIEAGTRYLAYLSKMFNNNLPHILAAYNAGEGAVTKYGGIPPYKETRLYVPAVIAKYKAIKGGNRSTSKNGSIESFLYGDSPVKKANPILILSDSSESIQATKPVIPSNIQTNKGVINAATHINTESNQQLESVRNNEPTQVARNSFVITLQNDGSYK